MAFALNVSLSTSSLYPHVLNIATFASTEFPITWWDFFSLFLSVCFCILFLLCGKCAIICAMNSVCYSVHLNVTATCFAAVCFMHFKMKAEHISYTQQWWFFLFTFAVCCCWCFNFCLLLLSIHLIHSTLDVLLLLPMPHASHLILAISHNFRRRYNIFSFLHGFAWTYFVHCSPSQLLTEEKKTARIVFSPFTFRLLGASIFYIIIIFIVNTFPFVWCCPVLPLCVRIIEAMQCICEQLQKWMGLTHCSGKFTI